MAEPWPARLRTRMRDLKATQAEVARWLTSRGVDTTRESVRCWLGGTVPETWRWPSLLDVLGVSERERDGWREAMRAARDARSATRRPRRPRRSNAA